MMEGLIEPFLAAQVARQRVTRLTARNYRPGLRRFAVQLDGRAVDRATTADVEAWMCAMAHLSASTRRQRMAQLGQFFAWCRRHGHMTGDPMAGLDKPRAVRRAPRALDGDAVAALFAAAPNLRARAVLALMFWCGLRCCEVSNLDLADWNRATATIRVVGKGADERVLPVPAACTVELVEYLGERRERPGPLIVGERWRAGERVSPDQLSRLVSAWCWRAGIKGRARDGISAHAARHTAASDVFEGCDAATGLLVVKAMLGHRYVSTTAQYLREARMTDLRTAMEGRAYAG